MEYQNVDEILKAATLHKKTSSEDAAVEFLISVIGEGSYLDHDLLRLLQKITLYFKRTSLVIRNRVIFLFETILEKSQKSPLTIKSEVCEEFAAILTHTKQFGEAENYLSGAIAYQNIKSNSYLFRTSLLYQKRAIIIVATNRSEFKKYVDYLYYNLASQLFLIAWHLFVDGNTNLKRFFASKSLKFEFKRFDIVENIINEARNSDYPFETKIDKMALQAVSKNKSIRDLSAMFQQVAFAEFPKRVGFKPNFFEAEYNDLEAFSSAIMHEFGDADFETYFPSKVAIEVDECVSQYLNRVLE